MAQILQGGGALKPKSKNLLPENVTSTIDLIIEKTKGLYWQQFINFVYSTYPIITSERYTHLNLVEKAENYRKELSFENALT